MAAQVHVLFLRIMFQHTFLSDSQSGQKLKMKVLPSLSLSPNMFDGKDNVVYNREWMLLKTKPIDTWISQGVLYLFVYPFTHMRNSLSADRLGKLKKPLFDNMI